MRSIPKCTDISTGGSPEFRRTHDLIDDAAMIRVYARENATQRGNSGAALAGSVTAAVRFIAKGILTGNFTGIPVKSEKSKESFTGRIATADGVGYSVVLDFLSGVPNINENIVTQQLANLKASSEYAKIISGHHRFLAAKESLLFSFPSTRSAKEKSVSPDHEQ